MKLTANQAILLLDIYRCPVIHESLHSGTLQADLKYLIQINTVRETSSQFFVTEIGKKIVDKIRGLIDVEEENPLNKLSEIALRFLLDRTNWEEPYCGLGFASEFKNEVERALHRKTKVRIW